MIVNRVFGKVVKHTPADFFKKNLENEEEQFKTTGSHVFSINYPFKKPFSNDFAIDTSKATSLNSLFWGSLVADTPIIDMTSCDDAGSFARWSHTKKIFMKNVGFLKRAGAMFYYASYLEKIPQLYLKYATSISSMLYGTPITDLPALDQPTKDGGWSCDFEIARYKPVDMHLDTSDVVYPDGTTGPSWAFYNNANFGKAKLGHDDVMHIINKLSSSVSGKKLSLSAYSLGLLSDDEKAVATNKGWVLSSNG